MYTRLARWAITVAWASTVWAQPPQHSQAWQQSQTWAEETEETMPTNIWQGTTGDWSTAGNWSLAAAPVTGDTVIIPASATVSITSGLTQNTVNLLAMIIEPECTIDVGLAGTPLYITIRELKHFGDGALFYRNSNVADNMLFVDSYNLDDALTIHTSSSTIEQLFLRSGKVVVDGAVTCSLDVIDTSNGRSGRAILTSTGTSDSHLQLGGVSEFSSSGLIDPVVMNGGLLTISGTSGIATCWLFGGRINFLAPSLGVSGLWHIVGGVMDFTGATTTQTFTTAKPVVYPRGQLLYNPTKTSFATGYPIYLNEEFGSAIGGP